MATTPSGLHSEYWPDIPAPSWWNEKARQREADGPSLGSDDIAWSQIGIHVGKNVPNLLGGTIAMHSRWNRYQQRRKRRPRQFAVSGCEKPRGGSKLPPVLGPQNLVTRKTVVCRLPR